MIWQKKYIYKYKCHVIVSEAMELKPYVENDDNINNDYILYSRFSAILAY